MRELWAKRIAFFTWLLVLMLAALFAYTQNPGETPVAAREKQKEQAQNVELTGSGVHDKQTIEVGRQVYTQQGCARCHSIAGAGNPRNPLDGVGARHTRKTLMDWITGTDVALPSHIIKLKQSYRGLPANDLEALVTYLQGLR